MCIRDRRYAPPDVHRDWYAIVLGGSHRDQGMLSFASPIAFPETQMCIRDSIEWLRFLRQIERETPANRELHLIADNYATHKHPAVQRWLAKRPRIHMHFTPTSASWLNMVERFFRDITVERLRRGVFTSVPELVAAIDDYIAHHNTNPKPFIWTKSARDILQKVIRANSRLSSKQNEALH